MATAPILDKFRYEFDPISGIIFKYYYGIIKLEDIHSSWIYAFENDIIPKLAIGFILDYRDATLELSPDEHEGIATFYKNHLDIFGNKKIAVVIQNPKDIVIPILVETKDDGYRSKPFYTMQAAKSWVLS